MFEARHQKLASQKIFYLRFVKFIGLSIVLVVGSLLLGAAGYSFYAKLSWLNAFHASAMILFSEGPVPVMPNSAAKTWEIFYSAYSGVAFFTIIGTFWAPVIHRFYHQFHVTVAEKPTSNAERG